ncbi:MAG TPA: Hsp70 family protein, partial [Candidatus Bathyarchaeia archaeon]|nr:Hsp70 family protein [Candidatus Bathyarchaeia archaeon]
SAIELQLGYEIFQTTDATKIDLSTVAAAILTYHHAEVDVDARLTRGRFEHLIRPMLNETATLVRRVIGDAGVAASEVSAVVYTGGSSAIPAFRALMHDLVPNAVARDAAAFTSVAAGLAMPGVTEAAVAG